MSRAALQRAQRADLTGARLRALHLQSIYHAAVRYLQQRVPESFAIAGLRAEVVPSELTVHADV